MLFSNQKDKYRKVTVDDCTMLFKSLSYSEVKALEDISKEIGEDLPKFFFYIADNYIRDEQKNKVVEESEVESIPVDFIVAVVKKFMSNITGTEEEIKKN